MKKGPRTGGRTRVLAGHEESDENVGNLVIRDGGAVPVALLHERGDDIVFMGLQDVVSPVD